MENEELKKDDHGLDNQIVLKIVVNSTPTDVRSIFTTR